MSANISDSTEKSVQKRGTFISQLLDKLGVMTNAATVYGEPVERGGVTVIPVATARWGVGGGDGGDNQGNGGGGGGGAGTISPVGYIEIKDGVVRYKAIFDLTLLAPIIMASAFALGLVLNRLRKLTRR